MKKSELYSLLWEACNKLRGGVEPARYKDYVLVLLFFKYVSDRYKGQRWAQYKVSQGSSFDDLIAAKNKSDVGEKVDKILQKFLEENGLVGSLPDVSFNNPDELGAGKELVDKVSGLIAVFQNPAIDFKSNRASGDDIIGDAYEYFMMKFAQESGKSKGQFYTPSEVSRIIARLIGIGDIKATAGKKWTLYDPAAGSGSLLIRAADEAPVDADGNTIVTIFGQEKDHATAGLAKMNLILHQKGTGEIAKGNTLVNPAFTTSVGETAELGKFDFVVMNPPFSDKSWSDGIKTSKDKYHRFDGYGIPPEKNGDFAWFLHVLKSLNSTGKAGIIMPHGVLFRGNAEEDIRREVLSKHYIKGIISLPANLFYGTGIPACIVLIDKENAEEREGIFLIDASLGYKKDGNKNRLREQDIERIVQVYTHRSEIPGYSRFVKYDEIIGGNGGNLNVPRYITKNDDSLPQNIAAHLRGGIPEMDIDSLSHLWDISPALKEEIFTCTDENHRIYHLGLPSDKIEETVGEDENVRKVRHHETAELLAMWKEDVQEPLLTISENTEPKHFIRNISLRILRTYERTQLLDAYDVYDCLLNYWLAKLQDDVYAIKEGGGYEVGREIDYEYAQKKVKDKDGIQTTVDDKSKVKSFDGMLIPKEIVEQEYFADDLATLQKFMDEASALEAQMSEMREEESGDDGLLKEVLNDKGEITKGNLSGRLKELDAKKTSPLVVAVTKLTELFDKGKIAEMDALVRDMPELGNLDIRNKNGTFGKAKLKAALKAAANGATVPEIYKDEYDALTTYDLKFAEKDEAEKAWKEARKALDDKIIVKYGKLTVEEIKYLLFEKKWMAKIAADIETEAAQVLSGLSAKVLLIAKRYEHTLGEIEGRTAESRAEVMAALERMGYKWQ